MYIYVYTLTLYQVIIVFILNGNLKSTSIFLLFFNSFVVNLLLIRNGKGALVIFFNIVICGIAMIINSFSVFI